MPVLPAAVDRVPGHLLDRPIDFDALVARFKKDSTRPNVMTETLGDKTKGKRPLLKTVTANGRPHCAARELK
jgi:hypothetical protein